MMKVWIEEDEYEFEECNANDSADSDASASLLQPQIRRADHDLLRLMVFSDRRATTSTF